MSDTPKKIIPKAKKARDDIQNIDLNLSTDPMAIAQASLATLTDIASLGFKATNKTVKILSNIPIKDTINKKIPMAKQSTQKAEANDYKIKKEGDLISVPFGSNFLKGVIKSIDESTITIDNYTKGEVKIPNNDLAVKMFPGQKFDFRELNLKSKDQNGNLVSIKDTMDNFLAKTSIGSFNNLPKTDQLGLLSGRMLSQPLQGQSLLKDDKGVTSLKNWEAKFQIYKSYGKLKMNVQFKQEKLSLNILGKPLTKIQEKALLTDGKTIALDRERLDKKTGEIKSYKVHASFDKSLNRILTVPFNKTLDVKLKADLKAGKTTKKSQTPQNTTKTAIVKKASTKKQTGPKI